MADQRPVRSHFVSPWVLELAVATGLGSRLLCEEADPLGVVHVHTVQHPRHIPQPRADSLASEHNVITCFVTNSRCRCSKHSIPCYHAGCIDCAQHWQQLTAGIRRVGRWLRNHHSPRQLLLR